MLSFVKASDTKLVNRPKMVVYVKFYRNEGIMKKILHSVQLDQTPEVLSKSDNAFLQK